MKRPIAGIGLVVLAVVLAIGAIAGATLVLAKSSASEKDAGRVSVNEEGGVQAVTAQEETEPGIVIVSVVPDGPADQAGVRRGDILLEFDGETVNNPAQLVQRLSELEPGDEVELRLLHGDEERALTVTLEERDGRAYLGLSPCVSGRVIEGFGMGELPIVPQAGITRVVPDSPADRAGLRVGDIIVSVDGQEVGPDNSLAGLIAAHQPGDTVTLEVERPGEDSREITAELAEHPEKAGTAYLGISYRSMIRVPRFEGALPFADPQELPFDPEQFFGKPFVMPPGTEITGAVIGQVAEGSPAEEAGLQAGDLITAVDGEPIQSPRELVAAVAEREPGDTLRVTVQSAREEETREVEVTLAAHPDDAERAYLGVSIGGFIRQTDPQAPEAPRWLAPLGRFLERHPRLRELLEERKQELEFDELPRRLFELDLQWPEA